MEAVRDFIRDFTACGDEAQGTDRGAAPVGQSGMDAALAALRAVGSTAVEDAGSWGFRAASDFAGQVEEFSRAVEYLQLVAAAAVDRTRKQSAAAATGAAAGAVTAWTTGWRESPAGWQTGAPGTAEPAGASSDRRSLPGRSLYRVACRVRHVCCGGARRRPWNGRAGGAGIGAG